MHCQESDGGGGCCRDGAALKRGGGVNGGRVGRGGGTGSGSGLVSTLDFVLNPVRSSRFRCEERRGSYNNKTLMFRKMEILSNR